MSSRSNRPLPLLTAGFWFGAFVALSTMVPTQVRAQSASSAPMVVPELIQVPAPAITEGATPVALQTTTLIVDDAPGSTPSPGVIGGALLLIGLVVAGVALTVSALLSDLRRRKRGYRRRSRRYGAPPSTGGDPTNSREDGMQRTRMEPVRPRG